MAKFDKAGLATQLNMIDHLKSDVKIHALEWSEDIVVQWNRASAQSNSERSKLNAAKNKLAALETSYYNLGHKIRTADNQDSLKIIERIKVPNGIKGSTDPESASREDCAAHLVSGGIGNEARVDRFCHLGEYYPTLSDECINPFYDYGIRFNVLRAVDEYIKKQLRLYKSPPIKEVGRRINLYVSRDHLLESDPAMTGGVSFAIAQCKSEQKDYQKEYGNYLNLPYIASHTQFDKMQDFIHRDHLAGTKHVKSVPVDIGIAQSVITRELTRLTMPLALTSAKEEGGTRYNFRGGCHQGGSQDWAKTNAARVKLKTFLFPLNQAAQSTLLPSFAELIKGSPLESCHPLIALQLLCTIRLLPIYFNDGPFASWSAIDDGRDYKFNLSTLMRVLEDPSVPHKNYPRSFASVDASHCMFSWGNKDTGERMDVFFKELARLFKDLNRYHKKYNVESQPMVKNEAVHEGLDSDRAIPAAGNFADKNDPRKLFGERFRCDSVAFNGVNPWAAKPFRHEEN